MSELTKEFFEEQLKKLATKDDLKSLATKQDVRDCVEELARIIAETVATPMEQRFAELHSLADVRLAVQTLQIDMIRIKEALHPSRD